MNRIFLKCKRKITQITAALMCNAHFSGFASGRLYGGSLKKFCVPGLNCYSCPGAVAACPLGSLQIMLADPARKMSFYVIGLLMAFGLVFGRLVCGWLCPFGLLQEILRAPFTFLAARFPALGRWQEKWRLPRGFRYIKYLLLAVFVIALPLLAVDAFGFGAPWFCEFICPAGMIMGAFPLLIAQPRLFTVTGWIFRWKLWVCAIILALCLLSRRFFCKCLCPLGAVYGLFNRVSFCQLRFNRASCTDCGNCLAPCPMGLDPRAANDDPECIRCGKCTGHCRCGALRLRFLESDGKAESFR
jgi:polyferredoxin